MALASPFSRRPSSKKRASETANWPVQRHTTLPRSAAIASQTGSVIQRKASWVTLPAESKQATPMSLAVPSAGTDADEQETPAPQIKGISYHASSEGLVMQVTLQHAVDSEEVGVSMYAFGYRRDKPFSAMPKLHVQWRDGSLRVFDQNKIVHAPNIQVGATRTQINVTIPWTLLGSPEKIFTQAQALDDDDITLSQTSWQVLSSESKDASPKP